MNELTASSSVFTALSVLALIVFICALLAAFLFAGSAFVTPDRYPGSHTHLPWTLVVWAIYFLGVVGGLMIIGHAAPLLKSYFPGMTLASTAVMLVAIGNIVGSIGGGIWAQRSSPQLALALPLSLGVIATSALLIEDSRTVALAALFGVGVAMAGSLRRFL